MPMIPTAFLTESILKPLVKFQLEALGAAALIYFSLTPKDTDAQAAPSNEEEATKTQNLARGYLCWFS
ncbi:MAG: hypothetical protein HON78_04555 [Legionellales bacterium]|jgi:hypothetical protein|nr:hypothetical protein [Legionellales bacterium]